MEKIFKNYNILINKFNKNKRLVEEYFYYIMTVCLFMNEFHLILNSEVYDYLFLELIKKMNKGSLGPLKEYSDYYKDLDVHSINAEIIKYLRYMKDNIVNPTPLGESILEFNNLKSISRTGWIVRGVPKSFYESDALHTMQMLALISMLNASKLISIENPKKLYEMALIHEIGEIVAGDITEIDPKHKNKNVLEEIGVRNTFSDLKCGEYFIDLWCEFVSKKTNTARLVYELDKMDAVLKANYLAKKLKRIDLIEDFFDFEESRNTFESSEIKPLFEIVRSLNYK